MKDQTQTGDTQLEESFYKWISAQIHLLHLAIPMFLFSPIATVKHKTAFNLVSEHSIYSVLYHPICLLYQRCAAVHNYSLLAKISTYFLPRGLVLLFWFPLLACGLLAD